MKGDRKSTRLNSSHTEIYTLSLHDALPISSKGVVHIFPQIRSKWARKLGHLRRKVPIHPRQHEGRSEEHTSELQSHRDLHSFPTRRSSDLLQRCSAHFPADTQQMGAQAWSSPAESSYSSAAA